MDFNEQLRNAITAKAHHLNKSSSPALKDLWRSYQANIEAVYSLLLKKGLLREDPYKKDHHVAEIVAPKDEQLTDSYKDDEVSVRLSEFTSLLDYINHYSSFAVDALDLKILKNLHGTLNYIRFSDFSTNSTKPTTRALADVVEKIKRGSDQLSIGAIQSSLSQLGSIVRDIEKHLKEMTKFKREEYKLQVRQLVLSYVDAGNSISLEIFLKEIKREFQKRKPGIPFFPELIEEIYNESYTEQAESAQSDVLSGLAIEKPQLKGQQHKEDLKIVLIDALRSLATATRHIDTSLDRLKYNSALLENRPKTFMDKFKDWIISLTSNTQSPLVYEVEIIDPSTSVHVTKSINFNSFIESATKRSRTLNGMLAKGSPLFQKLMNASEDQVYSYLDKSSKEVSEINLNLDALDTFFKTEVNRYERDKIRGVKNEVAAVKNSLHNAVQKKHEYLAKKEEREQLKKLGIQ